MIIAKIKTWLILAGGFVLAVLSALAVGFFKGKSAGKQGDPIRFWRKPLPYYLSGVKGWRIQQAGYLGLAVGEALLAVRYTAFWPRLTLIIVLVGINVAIHYLQHARPL